MKITQPVQHVVPLVPPFRIIYTMPCRLLKKKMKKIRGGFAGPQSPRPEEEVLTSQALGLRGRGDRVNRSDPGTATKSALTIGIDSNSSSKRKKKKTHGYSRIRAQNLLFSRIDFSWCLPSRLFCKRRFTPRIAGIDAKTAAAVAVAFAVGLAQA